MHCRKRRALPAVLLIGALAACGGQTTTLGDPIPAVGGAPEPRPLATPEVGECRMLDGSAVYTRNDATPAIPCSEKHTAITFVAGTVPDEPPFDDAIKQACEDGFEEAMGLTQQQSDLTIFGWDWREPSARDYALGARSYRCDVVSSISDAGEPFPLPPGGLPLFEGEKVPDAYSMCRTSKEENVPCTAPHAWRATGSFEGTGKKYPSDATIKRWARDKCPDQVTSETYLFSWPGSAAWADYGDRTIFCWTADQRS